MLRRISLLVLLLVAPRSAVAAPASGELPRWDDTPSPEPRGEQLPEASEPADEVTTAPSSTSRARARTVPQDGRGALVLAGIGYVGGLSVLTATNVMLVGSRASSEAELGDDDPSPLFAGLYVTSAVMLAGAGVATAVGVLRAKRYRRWIASEGLRPPPRGSGMLVGGIVSLGAATVTGALAGLDGGASPGFSRAMLATALGCVVLGAPLLTFSVRRQVRYGSWTTQHLALTPTLAPLGRHGATVSLAGRF